MTSWRPAALTGHLWVGLSLKQLFSTGPRSRSDLCHHQEDYAGTLDLPLVLAERPLLRTALITRERQVFKGCFTNYLPQSPTASPPLPLAPDLQLLGGEGTSQRRRGG